MSVSNRFPNKDLLHPGAIRHCIAHLVFSRVHPFTLWEQSWDKRNYSRSNGQGTHGTITFLNDGSLVAAFFSARSEHNPFPEDRKKDFSYERFFKGIPKRLLDIAKKKTLRYVLEDVDGAVIPVITGSFWADTDEERLRAAKPWKKLWADGAELFRFALLSEDKAMAAFEEEYEFQDDDLALVGSMATTRLKAKKLPVQLTAQQSQAFRDKVKDKKTLQECVQSLKAMQISLPRIGR